MIISQRTVSMIDDKQFRRKINTSYMEYKEN